MPPLPCIAFDKVCKKFEGIAALRNVTFDVLPGEIHAVVGENGAGKSTLMKLLAGVHQPDSGELRMRGQSVRLDSPSRAQDHGISVVFQELSLFPHRSVAANLFIHRELASSWGWLDVAAMRSEATRALTDLQADIDPDARVDSLTLAERQLVEIARALQQRSRVIILDEPNSALNEAESQRLFAILRTLRSEGVTALYVSHRLEEVFDLADRISVLRDGEFQGTFETSRTTIPAIIQAMVGGPLDQAFPPRLGRLAPEPVVLEIQDLIQGPELGPISFTARRGEILAFAGLEGSGVDELFRALFALDGPARGELSLQGRRLRQRTPGEAMRNGWALVPESRREQGLMTEKSLSANITLTILERLRNALGLMSGRRVDDSASDAIREFGIVADSVEQSVGTLSGGNQQKALLAKWLSTKPGVLLLNDPTRGVDVGAKREIYALCRRLAAQGMTILVASSETDELLGLADRILVLAKGRIRNEFQAGEATKSVLLRAMIHGGLMLPESPIDG
ncbi:MAG: sugar ABC transporter ATP-binding protein [Verrucomicrobia bacterium]|nr:sugar ABC transporter ATP-binding protein [Verrucomicrobiota bacterium]MBI3870281.1 sugar ABC transporter ATP-binding protein [Verrucomicrobiota bacterium]